MNQNKLNEEYKVVSVKKLRNKKESLFPKYHSQIYNLHSQNQQATRARNVGQMSDILPKFIEEFIINNNRKPNAKDWKKYYLTNYEENYNKGKEILISSFDDFKKQLNSITKQGIVDWYEDFIFEKNLEGFLFENEIKKYLEKNYKVNVQFSDSIYETKGIDLIVNNNIFIQIKPISISFKENQTRVKTENIYIIYYEKKDTDIKIFIPNELDTLLS